MEKILEYIDALLKSQKEFMENGIAATWKIQESLLSMGVTPEGPAKEILTQYKSWFTRMVNSSKALTDGVERVQETWKNTMRSRWT